MPGGIQSSWKYHTIILSTPFSVYEVSSCEQIFNTQYSSNNSVLGAILVVLAWFPGPTWRVSGTDWISCQRRLSDKNNMKEGRKYWRCVFPIEQQRWPFSAVTFCPRGCCGCWPQIQRDGEEPIVQLLYILIPQSFQIRVSAYQPCALWKHRFFSYICLLDSLKAWMHVWKRTVHYYNYCCCCCCC